MLLLLNVPAKLNVQQWIAVNEEEVRKVKVAINDVVSSINETKANIEAFEQESQEQLRARTMSYDDITSKYRNDDLSSFRAREEVLRKKEGNLRKDKIILLKQQMIEMQRLAKRYDDSGKFNIHFVCLSIFESPVLLNLTKELASLFLSLSVLPTMVTSHHLSYGNVFSVVGPYLACCFCPS